jgi:hypothetical protein
MDMDAYREAFDIHGEDVTCNNCGMVFDGNYCDHYDYVPCNHPGCEEKHAAPLCDRCYHELRVDRMSPEEYDEWYVFGDMDRE